MATNTMDMVTDQWLAREAGQELALAPLVNKIAYGLARGLVVAMKELENHIASETRNVGDTVGRRLDTLQASFQDLSERVSEQRKVGAAVQEQCRQLESATASLKEADAQLTKDLTTLRTESKEFSTSVSQRVDTLCKDLGIQQEDLSAMKAALGGFSSRVDAVVERLDKQAEALRSIYATYAQRETELEQLVDGLARLRSYPTNQSPVNGL